jgi:hypothetical protein
VGDARNTPGRSMFVRLSGPESGPGAAGRWTDAASAEYGDQLDVIRESCGLVEFRDVAEEARRFLRRSRRVLPTPGSSPHRRPFVPGLRAHLNRARAVAHGLDSEPIFSAGFITCIQ